MTDKFPACAAEPLAHLFPVTAADRRARRRIAARLCPTCPIRPECARQGAEAYASPDPDTAGPARRAGQLRRAQGRELPASLYGGYILPDELPLLRAEVSGG